MKVLSVISIIFSASALTATAAEIELNSSEIKALIKGNSVDGVHYKKEPYNTFLNQD